MISRIKPHTDALETLVSNNEDRERKHRELSQGADVRSNVGSEYVNIRNIINGNLQLTKENESQYRNFFENYVCNDLTSLIDPNEVDMDSQSIKSHILAKIKEIAKQYRVDPGDLKMY